VSDTTAPLAVSPLNRPALWNVIVGLGVWAVDVVIGGVLMIKFVATPVAGGFSDLGPAVAVRLSSQVLTLVLILVALIIGFTLARRGLRPTHFAGERGRAGVVPSSDSWLRGPMRRRFCERYRGGWPARWVSTR
jgi:hypothetical protein